MRYFQGRGHPAAAVLLCLLIVLAVPAGLAQPDSGASAEDSTVLDEEVAGPVTRQQALQRVRARFDGDVISISEVETEDGRVRFRIRLDDNGNIFTVYVDRATGRVSRDAGGD